jgi:hypothetical protein
MEFTAEGAENAEISVTLDPIYSSFSEGGVRSLIE